MILGDLNAHVGSRECVGDQWGSARGSHGYGVINDAGIKFPSFLSVHQATVCKHVVCEEIHTPTDMVASKVQAVELH